MLCPTVTSCPLLPSACSQPTGCSPPYPSSSLDPPKLYRIRMRLMPLPDSLTIQYTGNDYLMSIKCILHEHAASLWVAGFLGNSDSLGCHGTCLIRRLIQSDVCEQCRTMCVGFCRAEPNEHAPGLRPSPPGIRGQGHHCMYLRAWKRF